MPAYCSNQPDIDLANVVADNIDDTQSQPVVEQFAKPLFAYARMPLAHGANELFPRRCEDPRCAADHIGGHALASSVVQSCPAFWRRVPACQSTNFGRTVLSCHRDDKSLTLGGGVGIASRLDEL